MASLRFSFAKKDSSKTAPFVQEENESQPQLMLQKRAILEQNTYREGNSPDLLMEIQWK